MYRKLALTIHAKGWQLTLPLIIISQPSEYFFASFDIAESKLWIGDAITYSAGHKLNEIE